MTATATFGVSRRESHDSASFYDRTPTPVSFSTDDDVSDVPGVTASESPLWRTVHAKFHARDPRWPYTGAAPTDPTLKGQQ